MLAVLYVQPNGCYSGLPGIDTWDEKRDARGYQGPYPVVAHPPCQLWGRFAIINYKRWGGEHNRPGNDGGCFSAAVESVRRWGGVLEHPAYSNAWATHHLLKPIGIGWQQMGAGQYVCEVWQSAYGHLARKKTWLFYFGVCHPLDLDWSRPQGSHQIGFHDQRGKDRNKPTISGKKASATPERFRDALIRLAEYSQLTGA